MKQTIVFALILLSITQLSAQFKPGDVGYPLNMEKIFREAHVKTQTVTIVDYDSVKYAISTTSFDQDGFMMKTTYNEDTTLPEELRGPLMTDTYNYYPDGSVRTIVLSGYDLIDIQYGFEYNRKGQLVTSLIASAEAREYTYTYDKNGNIAQRDGKGARFVYENDDDTEGKLVMVDLERNIYTWDNNGNLIENVFYYRGEWAQRTTYHYNDKQQIILMEVYNESDPTAKPSFNVTYIYNDKGLLTETLVTETDYTQKTEYSYTFY